jgi:aldehyde:ferredoxin oxidoreductase
MDYLFKEPLEGMYPDPECRVPGKDGKIVSRKGAVINRKEFEELRGEYYQLRGWDVDSGLPSVAKLKALQLGDISDDLQQRGLVR